MKRLHKGIRHAKDAILNVQGSFKGRKGLIYSGMEPNTLQQSCGAFDPRGSRQISMQAWLLGSLLAGIKHKVFQSSGRCR